MTHEQFLHFYELEKKLNTAIEDLKKKLDTATEALEFFANDDNYKCTEHGACSVKNTPVNAVGLEIARKALNLEKMEQK